MGHERAKRAGQSPESPRERCRISAQQDIPIRAGPLLSSEDASLYAEGIVATVREPLVVLGGDLRVKSANRSFYQTFQVSPQETANQHIYDLGNGQWNIPRLRVLLEEILAENTSFDDFEVEHTFSSIGRRTMLLSARKLYGMGNQAETILLAIEDITGRKQSAHDLEASEIRYRRLFETAQDAILILDADNGEIIDANPYLLKMLGYSLEQLRGKELWEIGLFEDIEASRSAYRKLLKDKYVRYEHLPLKTIKGRHNEVEFVSNVYEVNGHKIIQCNIRDITERRRAEEGRKDADRRKDEFLAMLSHELRNPLAPLATAVEVMRHHDLHDPELEWVRDVVKRQVQQMTRLVDDLLEVSRITSGKITLRQEVVKLADVVSMAVETSRGYIDKREHELTLSLPAEPILLKADAARVAQLFANLLNNAAKYTEPHGHIWLTAERKENEVEVRVRDNGIGIAPEMLPHVFDLFTQADQALARSQGGLGIGLTLVRRIVELHGGTVQVTSPGLGQGSEFTVRLPVPKKIFPTGPSPYHTVATVLCKRLRVLVVDDNVDTAAGMTKLLQKSGHDVQTAYDGLSALDTARSFKPEVVLLDIGLPNMDGYQVAARLRQEEDLAGAVIVAVSGYGQETDRCRSREAGFDHHLVKPIDFGALLALLAQLASPILA